MMSEVLQVTGPDLRFEFASQGEWPERRQRLWCFRLANSLAERTGKVHLCLLIYAVSSKAEKIFSCFEFEEEERKKDYITVLKKFDDYFIPRRSLRHERTYFYQRSQLCSEKAEAHIRPLYKLAQSY